MDFSALSENKSVSFWAFHACATFAPLDSWTNLSLQPQASMSQLISHSISLKFRGVLSHGNYDTKDSDNSAGHQTNLFVQGLITEGFSAVGKQSRLAL